MGLNDSSPFRIGIDIGGTHISAAKVGTVDRRFLIQDLYQQEVDTGLNAESIISSWTQAISKVSEGRRDVQFGISMPGPFDYDHGVSRIQVQGKMKALYGLSVKDLLAEQLQVSTGQIKFINDAEAFLTGESLAGSGMGLDHLIGITLGTGLGSAIKVQEVTKDAKLWTAPFRNGIAEDYLGTRWFVNKAFAGYGVQIAGVKDLLDSSFDPGIAQHLFEEFGRTLGEFLIPYLVRLQIQKVILGGKISQSAPRFVPATLEYLRKFGVQVPIEVSHLGENAALIGAISPFLNH